MNDANKTTLPKVLPTGPTCGSGRAIFDQLVSYALPIVCLRRNLGRKEATVRSVQAQVQLVKVDPGSSSNVLKDALAYSAPDLRLYVMRAFGLYK